jgi:hypothetical protein
MIKVIFTLTAAVSSMLGQVCQETQTAPKVESCRKEINQRMNVPSKLIQAEVNQKQQSPS